MRTPCRHTIWGGGGECLHMIPPNGNITHIMGIEPMHMNDSAKAFASAVYITSNCILETFFSMVGFSYLASYTMM